MRQSTGVNCNVTCTLENIIPSTGKLRIVISPIILLTAFHRYKMYNYKIKTSFFGPRNAKGTGQKNGFSSYDCTFLHS